MANQDLIYSILPRPPAVPGSSGVAGEIRQVRQVTGLDKKSRIEASREDPERRQQQTPPHTATVAPAAPVETEGEVPPDPPHQIDLFV